MTQDALKIKPFLQDKSWTWLQATHIEETLQFVRSRSGWVYFLVSPHMSASYEQEAKIWIRRHFFQQGLVSGTEEHKLMNTPLTNFVADLLNFMPLQQQLCHRQFLCRKCPPKLYAACEFHFGQYWRWQSNPPNPGCQESWVGIFFFQ